MKRGPYKPLEAEKQIAGFWEKDGIFKKYMENRRGCKKYYFMDGPPYATGSIHLGTALNKVLKDFFMRFFSSSGFDVSMQPGYDTHGLPIENKIEKQLGFRTKADIEQFGVGKFNAECRKFATKYIEIMNAQFKDLGVWMDWDKPYLTLDKSYIEGAWYTFKKGFENGLLYRGEYPVHVCSRCETVLAFNEIEHKEVQDNSIYVKFKLKDRNEHLLVWTTTPWTLPANTGIMVDPEADYEAINLGKDVLIVAKELEEKIMRIGKAEHYTIERTLKGKDMVGWEYENPLKDLPLQKDIHGIVVASEQYVTLDDGTGLVHLAPGHGKEDYIVGVKFNLPVLSPVTMGGKFKAEAGWLEGKFVKDADKEIIEKLGELGALFAIEQTTHEYPKCWRCDSSLLFVTVPQWFFRVSAIREKLIEENRNVNWVPRFASDNFNSWLNSLGDWPISRQRYWGIPLPIWTCEKCDSIRIIGSSEELGVEINDLHKPYIDEVFLECGCGNRMRRIPDVLDVWFDSGVSSWASIGFPKSREEFDKKWPADLNIEGPDQFRGWWNSQMIASVITFGQKPFKNVLLHGKSLDMKGAKMSKSKGNIITPGEVVEKYGRDALRLYFLGLPAGEDFSFNAGQVKESLNTLNTLWNSFSFLESYCSRVDAPGKLEFEDLWIISRINSVLNYCYKNGSEYNVPEYVRVIREFILKDLSRWYIRLVRERTWPSYGGEDKNAAFYTMYYVFDRLIKILAPVCPFISEAIYQAINPPKKSVHLEDWPDPDSAAIDGETERSMEGAREMVEALNSLRQENNLRLRWPLRSAAVIGMEHSKTAKNVIERAANVKEVLFSEHARGAVHKDLSDGKVFLDVSMDESLIEESMIMELIRKIQTMRKEKQLDVRDNIVLFIRAGQKAEKSMKAWEDTIKKAVGATRIEFAEHGHAEILDFEGAKINIGFDVVDFRD